MDKGAQMIFGLSRRKEDSRLIEAIRHARSCLEFLKGQKTHTMSKFDFAELRRCLGDISGRLDEKPLGFLLCPEWPELLSLLNQLLESFFEHPSSESESQVNKSREAIHHFFEKIERVKAEIVTMKEENETLSNQLKEKELVVETLRRENEEILTMKRETETLSNQLKEKDHVIETLRREKGEIPALKQDIETLAKQLKEKDNVIETLRREIGDIPAMKRDIGTMSNQLKEKDHVIETLRREIGDIPAMKRDIGTMSNTLEEKEAIIESLKQDNEETSAMKREIETLSNQLKEKEVFIEHLRQQHQLEMRSLRADKSIASELLGKTEEIASLQVQVQQREKELKKLRDFKEKDEALTCWLASTLEKQYQVEDEIRHQLQRATEERRELLDFQKLLKEAVAMVEQRQEEAAANTADTEFRLQTEAVDEHFMDRLPEDLKIVLIKIQRLVGGLGRKFGEALLGSHVTWTREELREGGLFFTCPKFWQCVRKWVEASSRPHTDVPLSLQHLRDVCGSLTVDPTSLREMSPVKETALETNFTFLSKKVMEVQVAAFLRDSGRLTEEAWTFLLMPGTSRQKMDRLLAVVYSLGEDGFALLMKALVSSGHPHVAYKLRRDLAVLTSPSVAEVRETEQQEKEEEEEELTENDVEETEEGGDHLAAIRELKTLMAGLHNKMDRLLANAAH